MRRLWPLLLLACADDLPKPELVLDLRILAVRAEPPAGEVGTEVTLDALVVAPTEATSIERAWFACVSAGGAQLDATGCARGDAPLAPCATDPEAPACLIGAEERVSYRLPQRARIGRGPNDAGQVVVVLIAADAAQGGLGLCTEALTRGEVPPPCRIAIKRLSVLGAPTDDPGHNPAIPDLTLDGIELRVATEFPVPETEPPYLSWFVTAGELEHFRTDAAGTGLTNRWTPAEAPGTAYVVVRDGRGGESWASVKRP